MNRKNIYRLLAIFMALVVAGLFMFCNLGLEMTPLTKFIVIFFGAIIGLQSAPAALFFIGMVKGVSVKEQEPVKNALRRSGPIHAKTKKILIVDKDTATRQQLVDFFENSHYEVETTVSAAYAIANIVQKNEPIIILGDAFEEQIVPADVVALMRKWNKDLQIISISDNSSLEILRQIREDGICYQALNPQNLEDNEKLCSTVNHAPETLKPAMI